ncbi:CHAT domain-containing protein [Glycomyces sp. NPDC046736]|uniref:CHAT domain-containing protein n=1 Tax=Glycomyces sp. NPDC046736 TaxID=3155615 RepID=UPI0034068E5C
MTPTADPLRTVAARVQAFLAGDETKVFGRPAAAEARDLRDLMETHPDLTAPGTRVLAWFHWCRYQVLPTGEGYDELRQALELFDQARDNGDPVPDAVQGPLDGNADDPRFLAFQVNAYLRRYLHNTDAEELERALHTAVGALDATAIDDPELHALYADIAAVFSLRRTSEAAQRLDDAIAAIRKALDLAPRGHRAIAAYLSNLGQWTRERAELTDSPTDLDHAVEYGRLAVDTASPDDPNRAVFNLKLAESHRTRYTRDGDPADLDTQIDLLRSANGPGHTDPAAPLAELGVALWRRFTTRGQAADLEEAVAVHRRAVAATPEANPNRAARLCNLANALRTKHVAFGDRDALITALPIAREAVDATPPEHPSLPTYLSTAAAVMLSCFNLDMPGVDIDEIVSLARNAARAVSPGDPNWAGCQGNLLAALQTRSAHLGSDADRDEAIRIGTATADAIGPRHSDYAGILGSLGESLLFRHRRGGDSTDLDQAVDAIERAARATPAADSRRSTRLLNLQSALWSRFRLTADPADLDRAVATGRECIAATSPGDPQRAFRLSALGTALLVRSNANASAADLDESVAVNREAARIETTDRFQSAVSRTDLGTALLTRFDQNGDDADLVEALQAQREAAALIPDDHPHRTEVLMALANTLTARFERDGEPADCREAADLHRRAAMMSTGNTANRIRAAQHGARLLVHAATFEPDDPNTGYRAALPLLRSAVELLPLLTWPGLGREDQQRLLESAARTTGADAAACALALGDDALAVRLLEQSRGVLWTQLLDLRSDLESLRLAHPALAAAIARCRTVLDASASPHAGLGPMTSSDRIEAARRLEALISEVRGLDPGPEFPRPQEFFRQPALETLLPPAGTGPVVVLNVSELRCDALIVTADGVSSFPLPTEMPEVLDQVQAYLRALGAHDSAELEQGTEPVLAWLWDAVAEPVLGHLGYLGPPDPDLPRIWWCPTGPLTLLPVHAAGHHRARDGRAAVEYAVPSYTPTLRALAEARKPTAPQPDSTPLIVAIAETPGLRDLRGARFERKVLGDQLDHVTVLEDAEATHAAVTAALREHRWVHLACHGTQNLSRPSNAGLIPHDWRERGLIGIGDLTDPASTGGDLAFLSACQTAIGGLTNLDEAVNLTAAMHYTGWRHVIGTLWTIADDAAPVIAALVYARLIQGDRIEPEHSARALHAAVSTLRDADPADTTRWARFVHMGP